MAQDAALAPQSQGNQSQNQVSSFEGGANIDVQQCYSCGGKHERVQCNPYHKANPPFTHWYACPASGDPLPIAIVLFGGNPLEVNNRVLQDVARAQHGGPLLFATFGIDKRGGVHLERHTHKFPSDRLHEAVELLRKDLAKEAPLPEPEGPLPRADLSALFGRPRVASGQATIEPGQGVYPNERLQVEEAAETNAVARNGAGSTDPTAEANDPDDHEDDEHDE